MNYIETSVALAATFNERRQPPATFWIEPAASSRWLEYEMVVRLHAMNAPPRALQLVRALLERTQLFDLDRLVLDRALQPFPLPVLTLDAIHLSTMDFLRRRGLIVELATYDRRLGDVAVAMGFKLVAV